MQPNSHYIKQTRELHSRDPPPYPGHTQQRSFYHQPGYRQSYSGSETSTDVSLSSTENLSTSVRQEPQGEENSCVQQCLLDPAVNGDGGYGILSNRQDMSPTAVEVKSTNSSTFYVTGSMQQPTTTTTSQDFNLGGGDGYFLHNPGVLPPPPQYATTTTWGGSTGCQQTAKGHQSAGQLIGQQQGQGLPRYSPNHQPVVNQIPNQLATQPLPPGCVQSQTLPTQTQGGTTSILQQLKQNLSRQRMRQQNAVVTQQQQQRPVSSSSQYQTVDVSNQLTGYTQTCTSPCQATNPNKARQQSLELLQQQQNQRVSDIIVREAARSTTPNSLNCYTQSPDRPSQRYQRPATAPLERPKPKLMHITAPLELPKQVLAPTESSGPTESQSPTRPGSDGASPMKTSPNETNSSDSNSSQKELRRSYEMLDKLQLTRSQPDLTRLAELKWSTPGVTEGQSQQQQQLQQQQQQQQQLQQQQQQPEQHTNPKMPLKQQLQRLQQQQQQMQKQQMQQQNHQQMQQQIQHHMQQQEQLQQMQQHEQQLQQLQKQEQQLQQLQKQEQQLKLQKQEQQMQQLQKQEQQLQQQQQMQQQEQQQKQLQQQQLQQQQQELQQQQQELQQQQQSPSQSTQLLAELDHAAIATRATQMVERLSEENRFLRNKLEGYYKKVCKLQKFETDIQKVHDDYKALVDKAKKRENLDRLMRFNLAAEIKRLKDSNKDLKDHLEKAITRLQRTDAYNISDAELKQEIQRKDSTISKLIAQNRDLTAGKERLEVEVAAHRCTIEEHKNHIEVLNNTLHKAQTNTIMYEEEVQRRKTQEDKVEELQRALNQLQMATGKREQIEQRLRSKLEEEVHVLKNQQAGGVGKTSDTDEGISSDSESPTSIQSLIRQMQEKEQRILELESELVKWEQKYFEETALRHLAVDVASMPKDARIAALEESSVETEKIIAEARADRLKHLEEVYQANRRGAELEAKVKTLQAQLAEKEAMIKVLQRHTSLSRTSSVTSLFGSPVHSPHPSFMSPAAHLSLITSMSTPPSVANSRQNSQLDTASLLPSRDAKGVIHGKSNSTGNAPMTSNENSSNSDPSRDVQKLAAQAAMLQNLQSDTELKKSFWQV